MRYESTDGGVAKKDVWAIFDYALVAVIVAVPVSIISFVAYLWLVTPKI